MSQVVICIDCESKIDATEKICPNCRFCSNCENTGMITVGNIRSSDDGTKEIPCPTCRRDEDGN